MRRERVKCHYGEVRTSLKLLLFVLNFNSALTDYLYFVFVVESPRRPAQGL